MNVLFVEYKIKHDSEQYYHEQMKGLILQYDNAEWLESSQQSRLYLEIWRFDSMEELEQFSLERTGNTKWKRLDEWIVGGPEKRNMWTFTSRG